MNNLLRALALGLMCVLAITVWGQTVETKVVQAEVVYVSGNDLVVKTETGQVRHFVVPETQRFTVNGKEVTVHELTPGTMLTATITTTTTPDTVTTVKSGTGTVWYVSPPELIVTLDNGQNKQVRVPQGQKFIVDGEEKTVFDLKKGMRLSWTIVKTQPEVVVTRNLKVTGKTPPPPEIPAQVGALLLEETPAPKVAETAAVEPPAPKELPKTATPLPLIGMLGLLSLAGSLGLGALRRLL